LLVGGSLLFFEETKSHVRHATETIAIIGFGIALVVFTVRAAALDDGGALKSSEVVALATLAVASRLSMRSGRSGAPGAIVALLLLVFLVGSYAVAAWLHPTPRSCFFSGPACDWRPSLRLSIVLGALLSLPALAHGLARDITTSPRTPT
jgi:hypothetical protein